MRSEQEVGHVDRVRASAGDAAAEDRAPVDHGDPGIGAEVGDGHAFLEVRRRNPERPQVDQVLAACRAGVEPDDGVLAEARGEDEGVGPCPSRQTVVAGAAC